MRSPSLWDSGCTVSLVQFIHSRFCVLAIRMSISFYHSKGFVAANSLHGWEINACLDEMSNCGMPQGMSNNLVRVHDRPRCWFRGEWFPPNYGCKRQAADLAFGDIHA